MNQISQEIKRLRSMLAPLDRADKIEREIAGMQDRLTHALLSLRSGTTRQKSQAIALVLEKVICKFELTNKHRKRKAIITGVEFVPCGIEDGIFRIA